MSDAFRDEAIVSVMVLMTLADGRVVEPELTRMRWVHGKLTGAMASEDEIRAIIARVGEQGLEIDTYLESIRPELSLRAKRRLLEAAFWIATADGRVLAEEDAMLLRIAKGLEIPPEAYRAAMGQMKIAREL